MVLAEAMTGMNVLTKSPTTTASQVTAVVPVERG